MRARYLILLVLAIAAALAFVAVTGEIDADVTHKGGTGHADGIDLEYTEGDFNTVLVMLAERPSGDVSVSIISVKDHQSVGPIAAAKVFGVEVRALEVGEYTVLVTLSTSGAMVAECQLVVGMVSYADYHPNGGSGVMLPGVSEDGKVTLRECTFEPPSGKSFKAWEVNGKQYGPGSTVQAEGDISVKAVWKDGSAPSGVDGMMLILIGLVVVIALLLIVVFLLARRRSK